MLEEELDRVGSLVLLSIFFSAWQPAANKIIAYKRPEIALLKRNVSLSFNQFISIPPTAACKAAFQKAPSVTWLKPYQTEATS
jgi:hypothetical protein